MWRRDSESLAGSVVEVRQLLQSLPQVSENSRLGRGLKEPLPDTSTSNQPGGHHTRKQWFTFQVTGGYRTVLWSSLKMRIKPELCVYYVFYQVFKLRVVMCMFVYVQFVR